MATLTVNLLGEPRLHSPGGPVACASRKSLGLFCYLALSGARHSRRELAKLFWGGANPEAARASLRTALLRLPAPLAEGLVVDRDSIVAGPAIDLDASRFAALASSDETADLSKAALLYGGELLKGLDIDATVEFDDWLMRERARWRQAAQSVFDRLIERHRERARQDSAHAAAARDAALAVARRWQELEPAAEPAHRWLIRLYLEAGRPDAASAQYETCRRELAVAAGRAPSEQTRALIESLNPLPAALPRSLPIAPPVDAEAAVVVPGLPGTPFFGRVEELAALEQLLLDPSCRLLTLQALGGMGKTRLASVLVNHVASRFEQGAAWVALETVASAAQLAQGIALALRIDLPPQAEPAAALRAALRSQHRLLVLDNFEHLLDGTSDGDAVEFVLALLRDAPRLHLLVTSREVLGLQEEWIYELSGLPCPDADAAPGSGFAATELFAQRARQAYAGFSAQAEWPHMVRLARLVEGMPLALELAAAWVRTVPCGDLVAAIDSALTSLASRHRDRPRRHLNLEAVVSTSWALLDREQQRALAPLCVFVGGFTHESAAAVADAPLRLLSALVGKSLVQRRADGRLGLHELVRQFLREVLGRDGDELRQVQRRHATFFADLLVRHRAGLDGARGLDAHVALTHDLANLKAAAPQWDLTTQADEVAEPWLNVLVGRGQQRLALEFAAGVLALAERLRPATKAQVWVQRGVARVGLGQGREAEDDLGNAAALARELGLVAVQANALVHLTLVGFLRDDVPFIEARPAELEPLLAQVDEPALHVRAQFYRAMLAETRGDNVETQARYQEALSLAERLGVSPPIQATLQTVLARSWIRMGRFEDAGRLLTRALPVHEEVGNQPRLAQAVLAQAEALLHSDGGEVERAAELARRALAIHEQSGHPPGISAASRVLGQALQALGRRDEARRLLARAADVASPALRGEAKVDLGLLDLEAGALGQATRCAVECIDLALEHGLKSLRWDAAFLASAVGRVVDGPAGAWPRWLAALLAETDLPFACRRRAEALRDGAGATAKANTDDVGALDDDLLRRMRDALQGLALIEDRDLPGRRPGTPSTA